MCSLPSRRAQVVIGLLTVALSACGGGSSPTAPAPVAPAISGLTATFLTTTCTREFPGNRGVTGATLVLTFNYTDADATLPNGHVQLSRFYNTGDSETHSFAVPSEVTMSGTTSGVIRVGGCPRYNDATSSTETVWLYDANNHVSNGLSVTVSKPVGAP